MKKLFTTLLLLGAVVGTQAQVAVTDFDPDKGTVTINYNSSLGLSTEAIVKDAIEQAFGGPGIANPTYPGYHGPGSTDIKDVVSTIILTGDWENRDTDKDGAKTIKKIVDSFQKGEYTDTLNLSACQKFVSKFVSVYDTAGGEPLTSETWSNGLKTQDLQTYFTATTQLPDETVTGNATVVTKYYESWGAEYTGDTSTLEQHDDGLWYEPGTNWNGKTAKTVFVDQNGNVLSEDDVTDDGNGNYTYTYTITHEAKPFLINKEYRLAGIIFPDSENFTFIPDGLLLGAGDKDRGIGLKKVVLSNNIVAIGNEAFEKCYFMDCNIPSSIQEIGHTAFEQTAITEANLAATSITRLRRETFEECTSLTTVTFPASLIEIQSECFFKSPVFTDADMSACHNLRMIAQFSFAECTDLATVKVCSHPKTLKGPRHGQGAFNNSKHIKTVEVVACSDVTDITQCYCETGAFDFDVTNAQTSIESVEQAARLIYPRTMPVGADSEYTSAFDFFVGDYKVGVPCSTHEELLDYWYNVPNSESGTTPLSKDPSVIIGKQLYAGNGWFEFINTGDGITIEPEEGEFLRTYSRTEDSGPVLLPSTITAYRAIDYASTGTDFVGKKNGEYVNVNEYETDTEPDYQVYADMSAEDKVTYKKYPRYSILTVSGKLLLRALRPLKVEDKSLPRSEWTFVESPTESYVPENTGVVLYSTNISEDAFLVFKAYTEYDYQFDQYPHTGDAPERCEEWRVKHNGIVGDRYNEDPLLRDDINMLQGSYGTEHKVAPVLPWNWEKNTYYKNNMQYRNFGFNRSLERWRRLTPGILRLNRAFAMIPIGRFDNHNENTEQMPDFTLEDHVSNANTILVFGSDFEDDTVDGIQTLSTTVPAYEQDAWYTLQGVKVTNPTKGVYIHNNKKVVIK